MSSNAILQTPYCRLQPHTPRSGIGRGIRTFTVQRCVPAIPKGCRNPGRQIPLAYSVRFSLPRVGRRSRPEYASLTPQLGGRPSCGLTVSRFLPKVFQSVGWSSMGMAGIRRNIDRLRSVCYRCEIQFRICLIGGPNVRESIRIRYDVEGW